ncbi:MAG: ABC transporter substrate-binding protein, partial [Granulosicoccus sp.]
MKISRRQFTKIAAATTAATVAPMLAAPAIGQGKTQLKMILNWRYQGPQSWFFLAEDNGYFAKAGIDMVMDQGNGSGAAVGQVAGGAYDVGFGDVNALIRLAGTKPEEAP